MWIANTIYINLSQETKMSIKIKSRWWKLKWFIYSEKLGFVMSQNKDYYR